MWFDNILGNCRYSDITVYVKNFSPFLCAEPEWPNGKSESVTCWVVGSSPGFETQDRRHQKSKISVSVASQMGLES